MPTTANYGWTTPVATDANDVPTDFAAFAAQVDGDMKALADYVDEDWATYAVTWSGTIGNGTVSAWWVKRGRTIHVVCMLILGTTTNVGSGSFTWSLPESGADYRMVTGGGYIMRGSAWYPATVRGVATGVVGLVIPAGIVSSTTPGSWGSGDIIMWQATYRSGT